MLFAAKTEGSAESPGADAGYEAVTARTVPDPIYLWIA